MEALDDMARNVPLGEPWTAEQAERRDPSPAEGLGRATVRLIDRCRALRQLGRRLEVRGHVRGAGKRILGHRDPPGRDAYGRVPTLRLAVLALRRPDVESWPRDPGLGGACVAQAVGGYDLDRR